MMKNKSLLLMLIAFLVYVSSQAQTFTSISLINPTLVSGTAKQPGAVYKYANAAGGGTNLIDAYISIVKTTNTGTNAVGLYAFDNPASVNSPGGYDYAFQPVTSCSNVNPSGLWTNTNSSCAGGYVKVTSSANQNYLVHFRLSFKKASNSQDTALNIKAAFIDIDGFGSGTEAEQNAFMPGVSYAVSSPTTITITQRADGLYNAEGQPANVGGIQLTTTTAVSQVTYLNRTFIDFAIGMNTHNGNVYGSCYDAVAGGRLASVSFANQPTCNVVYSTNVTLAGTVWDDADGSANNTFTNIRTNSEPGTNGGGLYVYALDSTSGTVIGKSIVAANGTWSIDSIPKGMPVKLVLSSANVSEGVTNGSPSGSLNTNWVATSPLLRPAFRPSANTTGLDFGIEQIPTGNNYTTPAQMNPGGTVTITVPSAAFTGTDLEDGTYPAGLTGKKVTLYAGSNGNLYYNGVLVSTSTTTTSFNPALVTLDPTGPNPTSQVAVTSTFTYSVYDAADEASNPKTITVPFYAPLLISGNVFDDANGDAVKATTEPYTNAGGLNAVITNSSNQVVAVIPVNATTGLYQFDQGMQNTTYKVILSTSTPTIGSTFNTSSLPTNWVHTGVNLNGTANTGNQTGIITVVTTTSNVTNQSFGIEQLPSGANYSVTPQTNPGGTIAVTIPPAAFTGTDPEDGTYPTGLTGKTVILYPGTNGNLYYNGTLVTTSTTITGFNPSLVTLDPTGPNPTSQVSVTSTFTYSVNDAAGESSLPKTITVPFDAPLISIMGTVWDDANGDAIKAATEPYTNAGGLYAVLTNSSNVVLQVKAVNATTGAYQFDLLNSNTPYNIILSTTSPAISSTLTSSSLPSPANGAWVNTGVNVGGTANTSNRTGIIMITTGVVNTANLNFGIEQIPVGNNYTAASQLNPGGTITVQVPTSAYSAVDAEDGTYATGLTGKKVTLTAGSNGNLYYNGTLVSTALTIASFNPALVTIDPTGSNPTGQINVTSTFSYSVYDAADQPSAPKSVNLPFEPPIIISGNVFDDANGNAVKEATEAFTNAGSLNAVLTNASGSVLQVVAVNATTGAYQFDRSISNTTYKVIITTANPPIGSTVTTSTLPPSVYGNWVHTGVNLSGTANTANKTGVITVTTATTPVTNQNFGIEQPPTGFNIIVVGQQNPGGTRTVPVPSAAFTGTDPEDGSYPSGLSGRKITLIAGTNNNLYYNGTLVSTSTTITSFNPALVTIDPTGPNPTGFVAVTSNFNYQVFDAAGVPSTPKTITLDFTGALCINIRAYLEGALMNNANVISADGRPLMRDDLRNSPGVAPFTGRNFIPTRDPYEFATTYVNVTAAYTKVAPQGSYPEFQQVTDSATVFGVTGQNAIVDWVFVGLRSKANNSTVVATRAALIQRDGDIVEVDGAGCVAFPNVAVDSYYVSVRHRSHLGAMTLYPQSPAALQTLVNLTDTATKLYDKGVFGPVNYAGLATNNAVIPGYRALWQGDFDANKKIKFAAPNDDNNILLGEVLDYPTNTTRSTGFDFAYGYFQGDYDMNSKDKFAAPNDDQNLLLGQILGYRLNIASSTGFDFMIEQLP